MLIHQYPRKAWLIALLAFILAVLALPVLAQNTSDEYLAVKDFSLPKTAVPVSALTPEKEAFFKDGYPFTGIAFETFDSGRLSRVISLLRGKQNGPMYLWYPDGSPQMSANYRQGRLHGRFLGWYRNGGIIYDMAINHDGYAGDYVSDDEARRAEDGFDAEGEGDAGEISEGE